MKSRKISANGGSLLLEAAISMAIFSIIFTALASLSIWRAVNSDDLKKRREATFLALSNMNLAIDAFMQNNSGQIPLDFLSAIDFSKIEELANNSELNDALQSFVNRPEALTSITFQLQVDGYIPVLAHPERYPYYYNRNR